MRRAWILLALAAACGRSAPPPEHDDAVHTLRLPELERPVPDGPGRAEFVAGCRTCHSPRYVFNQPRFPRKTWAAEVEKMRTAYGAPIPPEMVGPIVDYLVAVNGTRD